MEKDKRIIKILKSGGVIVYPTETAYALGCAATDEAAIALIFKIKGRIKTKTLPLIVGSVAMAKKWFVFNKKELALAKKFWPGPLTLILKARLNLGKSGPSFPGKPGRLRKSDFRRLSKHMVAKDGTAAVRVSGHKWARRLSAALGEPLVSTSANISGQGECYSVATVKRQLGKRIKMVEAVINVGRLPKRAPSTIARVQRGKIIILRAGPVIPCF